MDKSIQQLLDEKDENVVQFNLVNNTSSDVVVDLFNLSLTNVPTQDSTTIIPPNGAFASSFGLLASSRYSVVNPNTGYIYIGDNLSDSVIVRDANFTLVTTIPIGIGTNPINALVFCPTNNYVYVGDFALGRVYIIDTATDTLIGNVIITGASRSLIYVPSTNEVWVTSVNPASPINIIDANTNTLLPTPVFPVSQPQDFAYDSVNNWVFVASTTTNSIWRIDATTKTLLAQYVTPQASPLSLGIVNNNLYVGYGIITTSFDVFDVTSLSFTTNVSYGGAGASIYQNNFLYIPAFNLVYSYVTDGRIIVIDPNTNTIVNQLTGIGGGSNFQNVFFNPFNNRLWGQRNSLFYYWTSTIVQTPFYIGGSSNYNSFVQSLNFEPIYIYLVRLLTITQQQLYNQVQITRLDSNGNQLFFPEFPITKVDSNQEQGNIAEIKLYGLEFNRRTYINQYVVNPNEIISIEIYYKQLDLTSATPTFPILFKPKVQLAEYLKLK